LLANGEEDAQASSLAVKLGHMTLPRTAEALGGREPRKVIYVAGRLVNVVV
jgi:hypothetical protein